MQRLKYLLGTAAVIGVTLLPITPIAADSSGDWPQFRGVNRDGNSPETGLLESWPEAGPRELWRHPIGEGYAGITIVGNRLYTMYAAEHEGEAMDMAAAFDAATGRELWSVPIGPAHPNSFGKGPNSTPTVDGDTLYVLGCRGNLVALASKDGKERWKVNVIEAYGSKQPHFGYSNSALVAGKQLLIEVGGPEGKTLLALNKKNGELLWSHGSTEGEPSYNSGIQVEIGGQQSYVYIGEKTIQAVNAEGNELWSHAWPELETHASPLFIPPDKIFASGIEGVGGSLFQVKPEGDGASVERLWEYRFMRNHFSSSVLHDGHIYGFDNANLRCIAVEDAESKWVKRGLGKGSLIYADGHLIVLSDTGKLVLLEASPEGYREKSSVQALNGRSWTAPTLVGGVLYLRNGEEIVAYDLNKG